MGRKDVARPRVVCVAIPIARTAGQILLITSRTQHDRWVLPKGGWETTDKSLEAAALREAYEEAGVQGTIRRFVVTISTPAVTYHVYEMDVSGLLADWPEQAERKREWVQPVEAARRLAWKPELAQAFGASFGAAR
ncbi:NUDIX hydrolase domain-like protein [Auriculariales sp. MPI-PUGE-AT-0066]|nr:NUDIX hydrolase domain-like protein [Auriculariales sp. MPI-PUGE-AT-0066]